MIAPTLRHLSFDEALASVQEGAAFLDVRPIEGYLDAHIPGSLSDLYEFGPGMAVRARDCLPLSLELVLLDLGHGDMPHAAASLRGKGFSVTGVVDDGLNRWAKATGRSPASTERATDATPPDGLLLSVGDPMAPAVDGSVSVPIDHLWPRAGEFAGEPLVIVVAGLGVRAALAVGMLERAGVERVVFWQAKTWS